MAARGGKAAGRRLGMAKTAELEKLLEQVATRDRDAFGDLYALTSGKLFGVCLRILASRPKAQAALWSAFVQPSRYKLAG